MGDYTDYPKLRLAHSHLLLKLTLPIHYLSFGKDGLASRQSLRGRSTDGYEEDSPLSLGILPTLLFYTTFSIEPNSALASLPGIVVRTIFPLPNML